MRPALCLCAFLAVPCLAPTAVMSQERGNALSLRFFCGEMGNAGRLPAKSDYEALDMGSALESGIALSLTLSGTVDLDFALSQVEASGAHGSSDVAESLHVNLELLKLSATLKKRYPLEQGLLCLWWGAGVDAASLTTDQQAVVAMPGGPYQQDTLTRVSGLFGIHGAAGFDVYPLRQSALAVTFEGRYSLYADNGPFDGDLDGYCLFVGVKWECWQIGM